MSIKQFFLILIFFPPLLFPHSFTVVLDPGMPLKAPLSQESLACVKNLQHALEETFPEVRIVLSRTSHQEVTLLQVASFSNRIKADLHISFNFFIEREGAKHIRIFTCSTTSRDTQKKCLDLALIPAQKVYEQHAQQSKMFAQKFFISAKDAGFLTVFEPHPLPLKPLQGVTAPSFVVEIGIGKPKEWKSYFPQLFEGIKEVVSSASEKNE
jgi:N-acetylmuramoyl-L-alanine amidase